MSTNEQSKTLLDRILQELSDAEAVAERSLPTDCLLRLEVALKYAHDLKAEIADIPIGQPDAAIKQADATDLMIVVIEHLEEIKKKVEAAK